MKPINKVYVCVIITSLLTISPINLLKLETVNRKSHVIPINVNFDRKINDVGLKAFYTEIAAPKCNLADQNLRNFLYNVISSNNLLNEAVCIGAPIKSLKSLARKITTKLTPQSKGSRVFYDFEEINDMIRSSVIFKHKAQIDNFLSLIKDLTKDKELQIKDKFNGRTDEDFRNYHIIFKSDVTLDKDPSFFKSNYLDEKKFRLYVESQFHLCGIFLVNKYLHYTYEARRILKFYTKNMKETLRLTDVSEDSFANIMKQNLSIAKMLSETTLIEKLIQLDNAKAPTNQEISAIIIMLLALDKKVNVAASKPEIQDKCFSILMSYMKDPTTCSIDNNSLMNASKDFFELLQTAK